MLQSVDRERSAFVNASYLRTFTESKLKHVKWETRLFKLRTSSSHMLGFTAFASHQLVIYMVLVGVTFVIGTIYSWGDYHTHPLFYVLIVGLFGITALSICIAWRNHIQYVLKYGNTIDPAWSKIRDEENKLAEPKQPRAQEKARAYPRAADFAPLRFEKGLTPTVRLSEDESLYRNG